MKKFKNVPYAERYLYSTFDKNDVLDDVLDDIICDICQNSCRAENCDDDVPEYSYLSINGSFGYYSKNKDCESWDGHVCEDCVDNFLEKMVCFTKTDYMASGSSIKESKKDDYLNSIHTGMNERADRIRKIRKMTGELEFKIIQNDDLK